MRNMAEGATRPMACRSGSLRRPSGCWPSRGRPPSRHGPSHRQPGCRRWWSTATSVGSLSSPVPSSPRDSRSSTRRFLQLPVTDDPIADLAVQALTCRRVARENPHLYDLMFGLSTRGSYRPLQAAHSGASGRSPAFRAAYAHVAEACARLVKSGRVSATGPRRDRRSVVEFRARLHHPRARGDLRRVRRPSEAGAAAIRSECFCRTGRYA